LPDFLVPDHALGIDQSPFANVGNFPAEKFGQTHLDVILFHGGHLRQIGNDGQAKLDHSLNLIVNLTVNLMVKQIWIFA
jgi:hypothetical protein